MRKHIISFVLSILSIIVIYVGATIIALILYSFNPFLAFVVIIPGAVLCYLVLPIGKETPKSFTTRLREVFSFSKNSLKGIAVYVVIIALSITWLPLIPLFIIIAAFIALRGGSYIIEHQGIPKTADGDANTDEIKELQDLKRFYDDVLLQDLTALEEKRKEVIKKAPIFRKRSKVVFICGAILAAILFFTKTGGGVVIAVLFLAFWLFLVIGGLGIDIEKSKAFRREFKDKIIQKLVRFLNKDFHYSIDGYIPESSFLESRLFQKKPDWYTGEDYVSGMVGKTKIEFSEIDAQYESKDGKGNKTLNPIFNGLLFIADFNKNFNGETILLPDIAENIFGSLLGSTIQSSKDKYGKLVKLEDPEFEKFFVVYSSDQIEARYILSTSLMKRLADFRKKAETFIAISFAKSRIYITLSMPASKVRKRLGGKFIGQPGDEAWNYFEPMISRSVLDFKIIQEYYEDLQFLIGIVEDLNLNTRIWSKQ